MEPSGHESGYEGPPPMQRPEYHQVLPPVGFGPGRAAPPRAWQPLVPPRAAPPMRTWRQSIGAGMKGSRAPWTRCTLPLVFVVIIVTNSLPLLSIAPANKVDGISSIIGWGLPADAWAFVLLLIALIVHLLGLIPALGHRLNLGVVVGALMVGGGLSTVVGLADIVVRTGGLPASEATMGLGPILAAIAGGLVVVAGVLELFQLPPRPTVRPHLSAYSALALPIVAILAFAPRVINATQDGRSALGYNDVAHSPEASATVDQAVGSIYDQIGNSGWSFALLNVAGLALIVGIIPALAQISSRRPIRIPVQLVSAATLLLAGLLMLTWFFQSLLGRSSIREELVSFPLGNAPAPDIELTFAAYLILALGIAALGIGALQATNGFHQPRPLRAPSPGFGLDVHPVGYGAPGNASPDWERSIGYRPGSYRPSEPTSGTVARPHQRRPPTP